MIKKSTIASTGIHIAVIILLLIFQQTSNILIPSRSDGMEVSLITPDELRQSPRVLPKAIVVEPIKIQATPAEINLTKQTIQPVTIPKEEIRPIPDKPVDKPITKLIVKPVPNHDAKNQFADMISDISPTATKHSGTATGGSAQGTSNSNNMIGNYADLVVRTIRPFIVIPNNISKNEIAIVQVTLLPNMKVYQIKLVKSSGNTDYDDNVQQAIKNVRIFPPLPDGAKFNDYRRLKLVFQPE